MTIEDVGRVLVLVLAVVLVSACGDDGAEPGSEAGGSDPQQASTAGAEAGGGLSPEAGQSIVGHLEELEAAYVAGDRAAAQGHLDEAVEAWSEAADSAPRDLATRVQLELDTLGDALAGASPAVAIQGAVGSLSAQLAPAPAAGG